jgi:hypothetical protein
MKVIRAHFDGKFVVPDEPMKLAPQSEVMILIDQDDQENDTALAEATRRYYEEQFAEDRAEDEAWGKGLARDSHKAWE